MSRDDKVVIQNVVIAGLDHENAIMRSARDSVRTPSGGWLKAVKQALGLSAADVAARMGIARQSFNDVEKGEIAQSISLRTLSSAADALDCDVVYFLVPKKHKANSFKQLAHVAPSDFPTDAAVDHSMKLEGQDHYTIETNPQRHTPHER